MAIVRTPVTAALLASACFAQSDYLTYVGGYGPGINAFRFHSANGRLTRIGMAVETPAASYLVVHPNGHYLYAVNEMGKNDDSISAFAIDPKSGKLKLLNTVSSRGSSPCHLSIDKTGRFLAVANYANGSVAVFPIGTDGKLGEASGFDQHHGSSVNPNRQKGPHAHCVVFSPDNRFLLSADLGADKIFVYRFDAAAGAISPNTPPAFDVHPGAGPRHLEFHPNGRWVYLIDEMASTVELLHYDPASGSLDGGQTVSTLPASFTGSTTSAEIALNAAGSVLYASNRGHDSLALFHIDPERGLLTFMEHASALGKTPRYFTLDPTGGYMLVANQDSDNLVVFTVHPTTGELRPSGPMVEKLQKPSSIVFVR
jgi:6-phosphogluconolactonase